VNKTIAFDLDGTLIDSARAISSAVNFTIKKFDFEPLDSNFIESTIGRPIQEVFAKVNHDNDLIESMVVRFREELALNGHKLTSLMPGVLRTLEILQKDGYLMCIASNKPSTLSKVMLSQMGIDKYFELVVGPDITKPKPHPEMLSEIAAFTKTEIIAMIGDTADDIECANKFGVAGLLYSRESNATLTLKEHSPAIIFNDFGELPVHIQSLDRGFNV
jgi:phosphoglycolate phosphatase